MQSSRTKAGSPLQSTRQMLDELDSLMERMLALPVGDAEELPPLPRDVPGAAVVSATLTQLLSSDAVRTPQPQEMPLAQTPVETEFAEANPRNDSGSPPGGPHFAPQTAASNMPADTQLHEQPRRLEDPPAPAAAVDPATAGNTAATHAGSANSPPTADAAPAAPVPPQPATQPASAASPADTIPSDQRPPRKRTMPPVSPASGSLPMLPLLLINQLYDFCTMPLGSLGREMRGERGRNFLGVVGLVFLGLAGAWILFDQISGR